MVPIFPYRNLVTDVTRFKTNEGKNLYLRPILDLAKGEVPSFSMSHHPDLSFVLESFNGFLPILEHESYRTTIHSD